MNYITTKMADGKYVKVSVSDEVYNAFREQTNQELELWHREHYRRKRVTYSDDEYFRFRYTGSVPEDRLVVAEDNALFYEAISQLLTKTQLRRVLMILDEGLSIHEVAEREGKTYASIRESLLTALKRLDGHTPGTAVED